MIRFLFYYTFLAALASTSMLLAQTASPSPTATPSPTPTADVTVGMTDQEIVDQEMETVDKPITGSGAPAPDALANEVESEITANDSTLTPRDGASTDAALGAANDVEGAIVDSTDVGDPLPMPVDGDLGLPLDGMDFLPTGEVSPDEIPDPNLLFADDLFPGDLPPPPPSVAENQFERERKLRVRYQEVKFEALKDQSIREMKERADRARTDEDKRAALREHYRMLFAKMVSIDPELIERCVLMERAYMNRLAQFRVEPTIPLNPPPTPEPLEL